MAIEIKNTSGADGLWVGQFIADGDTYDVPMSDRSEWTDDPDVFADISSGNLTVSNGTDDLEPLKGWRHLEGTLAFPISDIDNTKVAVHTSYKPVVPGITTYAVWTGAGDDIANGEVGQGDLLHFCMGAGSPKPAAGEVVSKEIRFLENAGRVWIHEGYLKFTGAGEDDYMTSAIVAPATQLQTSVNLDLELVGSPATEVVFASGGAGTGTHGFAATPVLIPRTFSKDGNWDFDGTDLTPNVAGTGNYSISTVEVDIHRYINKIPCFGDNSTYFSMSSDETSELVYPYYVRVDVHNKSGNTWHLSALLEIYRERTV